MTTDPDAVVHVSAQANDARAIISACGIDKVVVFGTSSGAIVALGRKTMRTLDHPGTRVPVTRD